MKQSVGRTQLASSSFSSLTLSHDASRNALARLKIFEPSSPEAQIHAPALRRSRTWPREKRGTTSSPSTNEWTSLRTRLPRAAEATQGGAKV